MKPTNEQVERARALLIVMGLFDPSCTWEQAIAQALADERERAMEEAAVICEEDADQFTRTGYPVRVRVRERAAAIRAAAKGE